MVQDNFLRPAFGRASNHVPVRAFALVPVLALFFLLAVFRPEPVRAEVGATFGTGERFYSWCVSKKKAKQDLCAAYLGGVADVLAFGPVGAYRACIPRGEVKFSQVKDVMRIWLVSHTEELHYSAVALAARALAESYPCK